MTGLLHRLNTHIVPTARKHPVTILATQTLSLRDKNAVLFSWSENYRIRQMYVPYGHGAVEKF
ncbi:hypothetical protein [Ferruginibacter sp. HRS2-29]|uniref:hypothetical protein n=1 Tax=Ferruginibacter sp. HRS2-29 TaxID=2487334 RepID=UPI0020CD980A|nr:hypothetical protein [Ferruginibacter sp. HRS2-29]